MKFLVAGLGNIGHNYENTRHNIGFRVLETLAEQKECSWEISRYVYKTSFKYRGKTLVLIKPTTFMNLSGKAVKYWLEKEKISVNKLLVVLDDLHIDFGMLRLKGKGSDAGHNGLKDINQMLGTNKYPRLRVGIGSDFRPGGQVNYVLGEWSKEESDYLPEICQASAEAILSFCSRASMRR